MPSTEKENRRIFLSPPHMTGREQQRAADAIASNWVAPVGPELERFESMLSSYLAVDHALAVTSGTAALHLILRCLGVRPGDEVLCSTLTFCASANPITYEGARPVFIDSEPLTGNLDPGLVREELAEAAERNRLPRAIVAVDIFGQSADMDAIVEAADEYEVPVVEDAAESLGATYKDRKAGASGAASLLSFNGNKMITASGGGAVCSNDASLVERAKLLATQAREPVPWYEHKVVGHNYRMSNVLAAIGVAQMESLDDFVAARRRNFDHYSATLGQLPGVSVMPEAPFGKSSRWLTVVQIDPHAFGVDCEAVRKHLESRNIESRRVWKPLHMQPVFSGCRSRGGVVAERLFSNGLCLPSGSSLTEADLDRVVAAFCEASPKLRAAAA